MLDILYLHGFAQISPQNTTQLRALRTALPEFLIHAPCYHPNGNIHATKLDAALEGAIATIKRSASRKMHLVGYSFGAWMCALIAERRPELVGRVLLLAPAIDNFQRNYALKGQEDWGMPVDFAEEVRLQSARPAILCPTTLVHGLLDNDEGGSAPWRVAAWAAEQPFAAVHMLAEVNHDLEPWISSPNEDPSSFEQLVRQAVA